MYSESILSWCLLCLCVTASPAARSRDVAGHISIPFTKIYTPRADSDHQRRSFAASLTNFVVTYTIDVTLGTPPQFFSMVLDTGSSDIWGYASESNSPYSTYEDTYYDPSASSTKMELTELGAFSITYATPDSDVTGYYVSDQVTVGGATVRQTIGVATQAGSGAPPGGIFGIGLSKGETIVIQTGAQPYPGYIDTLAYAGLITARAYSIFLTNTSATDGTSGTKGTIIFGGYDSDRWTGDLVAFPIVQPAPDGVYRLNIAEPSTSFTIGGQSTSVTGFFSNFTVILDTGTTLTYLPVNQFDSIAYAVGAQAIEDGQLYVVSCSLAQQPGGIDYAFSGPNGSVTISVPWVELVIQDPTLPDGYCGFGLLPATSAEEIGFYILGDTFLRSAYLVYNFDDMTISLAQVS